MSESFSAPAVMTADLAAGFISICLIRYAILPILATYTETCIVCGRSTLTD